MPQIICQTFFSTHGTTPNRTTDARSSEGEITDFCSTHGIEWKFIPQRSPHFGRLWEATVKRMKFHFKRVVGDVKLTFEELMTVLCQIESSKPLNPLPAHDDD